MARRVEEIKRVRREIRNDSAAEVKPSYEEEYYEVGEPTIEESGLNTASGVLALILLALAIYLIWAAIT